MNKNLLYLIGGFSLILIFFFSYLLLSNLNLFNQTPEENEPPVLEDLTIGARIARYIDTRRGQVSFTWCYNNSIINSNLTDLIGDYCDGVLTYGDLSNETQSDRNISVVGIFGQKTGYIDNIELSSVVGGFISVLQITDKNSSSVTDWNEISPWPPTFWWDIAFDDNTSISILYSKEQKMITAINGTWEMSSFGLNETTFIDFPNFEYNWDDYVYQAFLELDTAMQATINDVIDLYLTILKDALI